MRRQSSRVVVHIEDGYQPKKLSTHRDTVFVILSLVLFMAVVGMVYAHKLYTAATDKDQDGLPGQPDSRVTAKILFGEPDFRP